MTPIRREGETRSTEQGKTRGGLTAVPCPWSLGGSTLRQISIDVSSRLDPGITRRCPDTTDSSNALHPETRLARPVRGAEELELLQSQADRRR